MPEVVDLPITCTPAGCYRELVRLLLMRITTRKPSCPGQAALIADLQSVSALCIVVLFMYMTKKVHMKNPEVIVAQAS
jgi:hypothetical protein